MSSSPIRTINEQGGYAVGTNPIVGVGRERAYGFSHDGKPRLVPGHRSDRPVHLEHQKGQDMEGPRDDTTDFLPVVREAHPVGPIVDKGYDSEEPSSPEGVVARFASDSSTHGRGSHSGGRKGSVRR